MTAAAEAWLPAFLERERLPASYRDEVERVHRPLADAIARAAAERPTLVVGV